MNHKTKKYCYGLKEILIMKDGWTSEKTTWWASALNRTKAHTMRICYDIGHPNDYDHVSYWYQDPEGDEWYEV